MAYDPSNSFESSSSTSHASKSPMQEPHSSLSNEPSTPILPEIKQEIVIPDSPPSPEDYSTSALGW
jgi:hypothetical protein